MKAVQTLVDAAYTKPDICITAQRLTVFPLHNVRVLLVVVSPFSSPRFTLTGQARVLHIDLDPQSSEGHVLLGALCPQRWCVFV